MNEDKLENLPAPKQYMNVYTFVNYHLLPYYDREVYKNHTNYVWCDQWWRHTEALARFRALWVAWEGMRLSKEPTSEAIWLIQYAEPIMRSIFSPQGCFRSCQTGHDPQSETRQPSSAQPPEGYFINDVESEEYARISALDESKIIPN